MTRAISFLVTALLAATHAFAADVTVNITDTNGAVTDNAVAELVSDGAGSALPTRVPPEVIIDQRHETFIPLVNVVRQGGRAIFTNNDSTKHQVYSFSATKQFEFEIEKGERSQPVVFDKSGVASIGCNIHDQMITYVYVAKSPFAAISDAKGVVQLRDVPPGHYRLTVWHPLLAPGRPALSQSLVVAASGTSVTVQMPLMQVSSSGMKHMHMGHY
jgi:plastocyanin